MISVGSKGPGCGSDTLGRVEELCRTDQAQQALFGGQLQHVLDQDPVVASGVVLVVRCSFVAFHTPMMACWTPSGRYHLRRVVESDAPG